LGVDLLSLSGHKFYGPKGVGALYVRDGVELVTAQTGGSHERGLRAGTHNTPLIVGLAKALELAYEERETRIQHYTALRDHLIQGVLNAIPNAYLTGHPEQRLPSHASFVFEGIGNLSLLDQLELKGIAGSAASACKTGSTAPSSVVLALGYAPEIARSSLRLTVGTQTTHDDIQYTIDTLATIVNAIPAQTAIAV
jgi:cysteine desulfurase